MAPRPLYFPRLFTSFGRIYYTFDTYCSFPDGVLSYIYLRPRFDHDARNLIINIGTDRQRTDSNNIATIFFFLTRYGYVSSVIPMRGPAVAELGAAPPTAHAATRSKNNCEFDDEVRFGVSFSSALVYVKRQQQYKTMIDNNNTYKYVVRRTRTCRLARRKQYNNA